MKHKKIYKNNNSYTTNQQYKRPECTEEQLKDMEIGLDDAFIISTDLSDKRCKLCDEAMLTPRDIFNIAKELKLSVVETIQKYCHTYIVPNSRCLLIRLQSFGYERQCVFFQNNRCSIEKAKPEICSVFPLGRLYPSQENNKNITPEDIKYFLQPIFPSGIVSIKTVREHLETNGLSPNDDYPIKWDKIRQRMASTMQFLEKKYKDEKYINRFCNVVLAIYANYDTTKEFNPQFEENMRMVLGYIDGVDAGYYDFDGCIRIGK